MASYNTQSATYTVTKQMDHSQSIMVSSECVKDIYRQQTKKRLKLAQLRDKVV
jgi:hypothetical protein